MLYSRNVTNFSRSERPTLLSFETNILGVKSVMRTSIHRNVLNVANRYWMKFSMQWVKHGILLDVLCAKYPLLFVVANTRNVDEISEMKDSLLIQLITSQCVNLANTLDLFDKLRKSKREGVGVVIIIIGEISSAI